MRQRLRDCNSSRKLRLPYCNETSEVLCKALHALAPKGRDSRWSEYQTAADHYSEEERRRKQEFVDRVLQMLRPNRCSTSAPTPAILPHRCPRSRSRRCLGHRCRLLRSQLERGAGRWPADLPLIADVARPTPAVGWCNTESLTLLERARQRFDCVMMLGILHHLLLADQIPMGDVAELLASLARRWSIVEWVPKTDVRYIDLCRGRDELYAHLNEDLFVEQFTRHFNIMDREELSNGRVLFLFERR